MTQQLAIKLEARDRRILDELEADAWLSYAELARRIHLSASATQRRVERLIACGLILGARARLAPEATRRPMRAFVLVELKDESSTALRAFAKAIAKVPDIVEAHYVAGSVDVLLTVQTSTMETYAAVTAKLLNDNPAVRRYQTLTVLRPLN
jgi:Lrp/AsnC family leucine-responsive transcriptional regulator